MNKLKAILFLIKCLFYISVRIIKGNSWNSINVYLDDNGNRRLISYKRHCEKYILQDVVTDSKGNTTSLISE